MPRIKRDSIQESFGRRVRGVRESYGWSQEGLADRARLHRTYVGTIERGQRNPSLLNIIRLATALKIDPAVLVAGLRSD